MKFFKHEILPYLLALLGIKFGISLWWLAAVVAAYLFVFLPFKFAVWTWKACHEPVVTEIKPTPLLLMPPKRLIPNTEEYMSRFMPKN